MRDYAYKKSDRALLDVVTEHHQRERKRIAENISAGQMVFAVLALGLTDYFPGLFGIHTATLLREIPTAFNSVGELAMAVAFLIALVAIKATWFSKDALNWIDYPPLYEEIERARRERREMR